MKIVISIVTVNKNPLLQPTVGQYTPVEWGGRDGASLRRAARAPQRRRTRSRNRKVYSDSRFFRRSARASAKYYLLTHARYLRAHRSTRPDRAPHAFCRAVSLSLSLTSRSSCGCSADLKTSSMEVAWATFWAWRRSGRVHALLMFIHVGVVAHIRR